MSNTKHLIVLSALTGLAACGGGSASDGPAFNATQVFATTAPGENLANVEFLAGGANNPSAGERNSTGGFAVSSTDGTFDTDISTRSTTGGTGPQSTVILDGQTYTVDGATNVSNDGEFMFLRGSTISGDQSIVTILGTGTDLDGSGEPDEIYGYVRGLGTAAENLPANGAATYSGTANYAIEGASDVTSGSFDLTVDFDADDASGSLSVGAITGTISGSLNGNGIEGEVDIDGGTDTMDLSGNIYGAAAQEFSGAAQGSVGGENAIVVMQGQQ